MSEANLFELYDQYVSVKRNIDIDHNNPIRWRIKTTKAGDHLQLKLYPARVDYTQPRICKHGKTREAQQKLNKRYVSERFRFLVYKNFNENDLYVTLTFKKEPPDKEKALEKVKYFWKKIRKSGVKDVKYLGFIESSDIDGVKKRIHIHVLISGIDLETIRKNWIYGIVHCEEIVDADATGIYISKTVAQTPEGSHSYIRSRNLENPEIEIKTLDDRTLADSDEIDAIIKIPQYYVEEFYPEYLYLEKPEIWKSSYMPGCYVKIEMIRRDARDVFMQERSENYREHQANELLGLVKLRSTSDVRHRVKKPDKIPDY